MNTRKPREHYQVIITSGTDARKKPVSFILSRRTIVIIIAVFTLAIAISIAISLLAYSGILNFKKQIEDLNGKIAEQSVLLSDYSNQIEDLKSSSNQKISTTARETSAEPAVKAPAGSQNQAFYADNGAYPEAKSADTTADTGTVASPAPSVPGPSEGIKQFSLSAAAGFVPMDDNLDHLAWPFQDPGSVYDTDWPGPEGYYHAPRDGDEVHEGVDICANHETPLYAVADGTVVSNGWNTDGGWMVEIRDAAGYTFRYLHMAAQSDLAEGTGVKAGQTILGYCGNTGGDYPNHLHLSIYLSGSPDTIDPTPYLKAAEERFLTGS